MTPRQHQVLMFLHSFIEEHAYSPTFREVMAGCGLESTNQVFDLLTQLEERGYIEREHREARGKITILRFAGVPEEKPVVSWIEDSTTKRRSVNHTDMIESDGIYPGDVLILDKDDRLIGMVRRYPDSEERQAD